jgi:large subunit ribosomal protein L24
MTATSDSGPSAKPGKQRKRKAGADHKARRKKMAAHLDEDLMLEFDRRSIPVREGDTVRIERGDFAGHEGEVLDVDYTDLEIEVDGATNRRADGTQVPRPIHPSNVTITDLHLTDPQRRAALERKGVEVEAPPEPEEDEEDEEEADEAEPSTTPTAEPDTDVGAEPEPEPAPDEGDGAAGPEPAEADDGSDAGAEDADDDDEEVTRS